MARRRLHPLTRLRYGLARLLLKASTDLSIVPAWVTTSVLTPSFRSLTRDGYQRSSAFFACVSALAFAFRSRRCWCTTTKATRASHCRSTGCAGCSATRCRRWARRAVRDDDRVYGDRGERVLAQDPGKGGQVVQLKPYHAGQIMPGPGRPNVDPVVSVRRAGVGDRGGRGTLPSIDPADIVHFWWPSVDPAQPWMSQPPIVAAATEVDADVEASRYVFALLQNDAVPRTVVTIPADRPLLDGEYERIRSSGKSGTGRSAGRRRGTRAGPRSPGCR